MEDIEFSVGFGGWCAVLWIVLLVSTGSFRPFLTIFIPIITITSTLLVVVIVRFLIYMLLWILSKMLMASVLSAVVPMFLTGIILFVIKDILQKVRSVQQEALIQEDLHVE